MKTLVALPVLSIVCLLTVPSITEAQTKSSLFLFLPAIVNHSPTPPGIGTPPKGNGQYTLIAWNELGMHCMDPSYEDFSVLPPYNTLIAQVIRRGDGPAIVASNITVEYRILGNTRSDNKTNFWQYAQKLFGLPQPLTPNIGLKGKGLSGRMTAAGDHFIAEGIPLTEYLDSNLGTPYPYQVAELVAKDSKGNILASTQTVAPVSTEMNCAACHNDNGSANHGIATGVVKRNILTLHDQKHATDLMAQRPVLCANCHSSNALGKPGKPGIPSLSTAIHGRHAEVGIDDGTMTGTCYKCHPGTQTKCLRGAMFAAGKTCYDCHGNLAAVGNPNRRPWMDEPRCAQCHDAAHSENSGTLYRFSKGHQGVYCQACHGSQHAEYPSTQPNDNIQSILLQGHAGTVDTCTVCHITKPSFGGPHKDTMHVIGNSWVSGHQGANKSTCAQCHGTTSAGTPYSAVKVAKTINAGVYGIKNWPAGYQVSCWSCHNGPNPTSNMHPIGNSWVSGHQDANKSTCANCHGTTPAGTPLSAVKVAETINAGEFGMKQWAAGYQVSCWSCHNGPNPE